MERPNLIEVAIVLAALLAAATLALRVMESM
jgi:hypothetical protein